MKRLLFIVSVLSLFASYGHIYLAKRAYQIEAGTLSTSSICNINEQINCDKALTSPFAKFFGMSISNFGFSFNLVLFLLLISFFIFGINTYWKNISFYLASSIAIASGFMIIISLINRFYCPVCWLLYVASFTQVGLLFWIFKTELIKPNIFILKNISHKNTYILIASISLVAFFIHSYFVTHFDLKNQKLQLQAQFQDWKYAKVIHIPETYIIKNKAKNSKMRIVEFADFLCPACKQAHGPLKTFLAQHPDVSFKFYAYPLDNTCNPSVNFKKQGLSCELSKAVICSKNHAWDIQNFIFNNQNRLLAIQGQKTKIKKFFSNMLITFNIDKIHFYKCLKDPKVLQQVKLSVQAGAQANITGTPSIFVNGQALPHSKKFFILKKIYKHLHTAN